MPSGLLRFDVGTIRCTVLSDGYFSNPAQSFFPEAAANEIPQEQIVSPYTCLLVQTGTRVVLVDTGAGAASRTSGAMIPRLALEGVHPRDVNIVILTHAHPDHVGGALDTVGRPTFPNACYCIAELEYEFWTGVRAGASAPRDTLAALRPKLDLIEGEAEIAPGVRVIPAAGHTPGHLAVAVSSGADSLLNLGDAATHPLHLRHPEWRNGFDIDPDRALVTRRRLLDMAAAQNMRVMAFHFPFPSVGRIEAREPDGWEWMPGWPSATGD